jgi:hypothetical protein
MGTTETKNVHRIMVETLLIKRHCAKPLKQMGDSIKINLINIGYEDEGWVALRALMLAMPNNSFCCHSVCSLADTVTWMAKALLGNGPVNSPRYAHATMEQRGYAIRFYATAR